MVFQSWMIICSPKNDKNTKPLPHIRVVTLLCPLVVCAIFLFFSHTLQYILHCISCYILINITTGSKLSSPNTHSIVSGLSSHTPWQPGHDTAVTDLICCLLPFIFLLFLFQSCQNSLLFSIVFAMVKKSNKESTPTLMNTILINPRPIILFILCLGGAIFGFCIYSTDQSGTKFLINADDGELKAAFFNDSPHLFYCHEHGNQVRIIYIYIYIYYVNVLCTCIFAFIITLLLDHLFFNQLYIIILIFVLYIVYYTVYCPSGLCSKKTCHCPQTARRRVSAGSIELLASSSQVGRVAVPYKHFCFLPRACMRRSSSCI